MLNALKRNAGLLAKDRRGLTTVEYVIILSLIAAAAVGTWRTFGSKVTAWLGGAQNEIGKEMYGNATPSSEGN